jgi:hypothetical protein
MADIEIPSQEWADYCKTFSLEHHGWLVIVRQVDTRSLEINRDEALVGAAVLALEQPLQEVVIREQDGRQDAEVNVGSGADAVRLRVENVTRLVREQVDDAHQGMRIDDAAGKSLLIEFRSPAHPEELDGLAQSEL